MTASIEAGKVYQLSPLVRRITAPNPGMMTGPGTNTYLIGHREVAVIDPGPSTQSHIDAILDAVGDRLKWVLVTHTHADHSPAARSIVEATGATAVGCVMQPDDGRQDTSFKVDRNVFHGELISGDGYSLEAIFTPGHIGNHFCYLLREEKLLFSGDHMMEGISVVIIPPSGDLQAFLSSLNRLLDYPINAIAPAHGHVMNEPEREISALLKHRQYREDKVLAALTTVGEASLSALVPHAYDDTDSSLHPVARFSLWAHLLKLEREGRAERTVENPRGDEQQGEERQGEDLSQLDDRWRLKG